MNVKALEAARDALIEALDAVNAALASDKTPAKSSIQPAPTSTRIIRLPDVIQRTGISRSFIYSGVKKGTFPTPVSLGARAVGWDPHVVDQWIQAKLKND